MKWYHWALIAGGGYLLYRQMKKPADVIDTSVRQGAVFLKTDDPAVAELVPTPELYVAYEGAINGLGAPIAPSRESVVTLLTGQGFQPADYTIEKQVKNRETVNAGSKSAYDFEWGSWYIKFRAGVSAANVMAVGKLFSMARMNKYGKVTKRPTAEQVASLQKMLALPPSEWFKTPAKLTTEQVAIVQQGILSKSM